MLRNLAYACLVTLTVGSQWADAAPSERPVPGNARRQRGSRPRLDAVQRRVIAWAASEAATQSPQALKELVQSAHYRQRRVPADRVDEAFEFLRDHADVHIYFQPDQDIRQGDAITNTLDALAEDGRYLSLWDTGHSNGSQILDWRQQVEHRLYNGIYPVPAVRRQRPVHGLVHTTGPHLDASAEQYGDAFLVVNHSAKPRATITFRDAFQAKSVGTFAHPAPGFKGLTAYDDFEISQLTDGRYVDPAQQQAREYIDVAFHGGIDLAQGDVTKLVLPERLRGTTYETRGLELAKRFGVDLQWSPGHQVAPLPARRSWSDPLPSTVEHTAERAAAERAKQDRTARTLVRRGAVLLDVRELKHPSVGRGGVRIPINQLRARLGEIPTKREVVVIGGSQARADLAVEVLTAAGRTVPLAFTRMPDLGD